jgi:hypothetical protein
MTNNRPTAKQVAVTKTRAQTGDQAIKVDLADIEQAMMREMEKALQKGKPGSAIASPMPDARSPYGTIWCSIGVSRSRAGRTSSA